MSNFLRFIILATTIFFVKSQSQQPVLGAEDNRRYLGSNVEIGVNILAQINSSYLFPLVISQNERVSLWRLARETPQSYKLNDQNAVDSLPIYVPGLPRTQNISNMYNCVPSEQNCNQLRIPNFDVSQVGSYSFRIDSANFLSTKTFQFNVSGLLNPIKMECMVSNGSQCQLNQNVLSVLADQAVSIGCSVDVVQNDDYPLSAQINLVSDSYGEECMGINSNLKKINNTMGYTSNYNMIFSKLSKSCSRTFGINDSNKKYSCLLNPTPISSTESVLYQYNQTYQAMSVVLDVQYGPDATLPINPIPQSYYYLFNKTIMIGSQTNFTCPFNGNPTPNYYWRVAYSSANGNDSLSQSSDFSLSSQDYTISRNLQVGSYIFECKAQVMGLVNNYSQTIQFSLNVIPLPTPVIKNENGTNVGAIVGGVVGGVALLVLIIIVIALFILYGRNKRNSKDEIEKAKELDIDITDTNGSSHLNQKTIPSNGLIQQNGKKQQNGIGNKVIAGLMVPNSTAQSYAAIAHAAAAAAQSNQQRNNYIANHSEPNNFNSGSSNNLLINNNNLKAQSYNNPGFFESTSYSIQNPLESPPPYETALHQPMTIKKDSPNQQHLNQQQKDYMGSNSRLISETNTPTQSKHAVSHSYSAANTPQHQNLSLVNSNSTPLNPSLHQLGYQNQTNLQYTSVHNLENRARSRNPLNGLPNEIDPNTQYSTIAAQLSSNPIDV